jgi:NAD(P) transhydrogenase subunit alpha
MPHLPPVHIGLLRETFPGERRVALTPSDVSRLTRGMAISFERGCGISAGHDDEAYIAAGGNPAGVESISAACDLIVSVRRPSHDLSAAKAAAFLFLGSNSESHVSKEIKAGALELDLADLEGVADAGSMDAFTTQATISGHVAVLEGARQLGIGHPMLMLDGSFVKPIRMAALGADVAALQAIATARRLGALTYGFGFGEEDRQKIEALGAKFIAIDPALIRSSAAPSHAANIESLMQLASHLAQMQLIVASVSERGEAAPVLIDESTIAMLAPATVVIDLAIGNCSMTKADQIVTSRSVRIIGSTTLASNEANEASRLFSGAMSKLLERLATTGLGVVKNGTDPIIRRLSGWQQTDARMTS